MLALSPFLLANRQGFSPEHLPVPVLAYVGDAVFELAVRCSLVGAGCSRVGELHGEAVKRVSAAAQARALRQLSGRLTAEEEAVVRRGRNARPVHAPPRGTGQADYRYSTALECLVGYLYLKGDRTRLEEILGAVLAGEERPFLSSI